MLHVLLHCDCRPCSLLSVALLQLHCICSCHFFDFAAMFAVHSIGLLHFMSAHASLAIRSLILLQVMAPLLDTNHELNWHANMVDAIEQKAANQRTEGGSITSMHAMLALLPLTGLHCPHNNVCCAGRCLQTCQGQYTACMLDKAVCLLDTAVYLSWACFVFGLSIVHLIHYNLNMPLSRLQMVSKLDSQHGKTADAMGCTLAKQYG